MNRKRNISYIKPEDPKFLKVIKQQAGYDDRNHKFDKLEASDDNAAEDAEEKPQIVVIKHGDLTEEQVEEEKKKIGRLEVKADLSKKVIYKSKLQICKAKKIKKQEIRHHRQNLLSFGNDDDNIEDGSG